MTTPENPNTEFDWLLDPTEAEHYAWGTNVISKIDAAHNEVQEGFLALVEAASNLDGMGAEIVADDLERLAVLVDDVVNQLDDITGRVHQGLAVIYDADL